MDKSRPYLTYRTLDNVRYRGRYETAFKTAHTIERKAMTSQTCDRYIPDCQKIELFTYKILNERFKRCPKPRKTMKRPHVRARDDTAPTTTVLSNS
jgi:hypothetical protein